MLLDLIECIIIAMRNLWCSVTFLISYDVISCRSLRTYLKTGVIMNDRANPARCIAVGKQVLNVGAASGGTPQTSAHRIFVLLLARMNSTPVPRMTSCLQGTPEVLLQSYRYLQRVAQRWFVHARCPCQFCFRSAIFSLILNNFT